MMRTIQKLLEILAIPVLLVGCATAGILKIDEVRACLSEGADIKVVTACIEKVGNYDTIEPYSFDWWWIIDYCDKVEYQNCSRKDLATKLTAATEDKSGKGQHKISPPGVLRSRYDMEFDVVAEPSVLFSSNRGNLGGAFVMLYVFYNKEDGKVIGWSNMGSGLHRFDFHELKR